MALQTSIRQWHNHSYSLLPANANLPAMPEVNRVGMDNPSTGRRSAPNHLAMPGTVGQGWILLHQRETAMWCTLSHHVTEKLRWSDCLIKYPVSGGLGIWRLLWTPGGRFLPLHNSCSPGLALTLCCSPLAFTASCHWDIWPGMFYS